MARFSKSLTPSSIKCFKKIMIFIREKEDLIPEAMKQVKEIITKLLIAAPKSQLYKEFFSFFREIFYYSKDMD